MSGTWILRLTSKVLIMKAVLLFVVLVALVAMAMAGTHHYQVPASDNARHGGGFFDRLANGIDEGISAARNVVG